MGDYEDVPSAIQPDRVEFLPVSTLRAHHDLALRTAWNENALAIQQLQKTLLELAIRVDQLEAK